MKSGNSKAKRNHGRRPGFSISGGPVIADRQSHSASVEFAQLPSSYGEPILFAIPRDPHTLFTYWNIDWSDAFARNLPADRKVYLRLKRQDGSDEIEEAIEPMLGTHFLLVAQPKGSYQVELGFYDAANVWNSLATTDFVTMPADTASEDNEVDVATVPFHLSFQRMIDLFRASSGDAIASVLSRFQGRAEESAGSGEDSNADEREILRAMNLSLSDLRQARRSFAATALNEMLRKRTEALLGFGATSPIGGFGGSSWSSGVS